MTVRVGFLRAVNLGKRKVEMARLKAVAEGLGHGDVWTYINSGNVVFDAYRQPREPRAGDGEGPRGRVRLRVHDLRADGGRAREDPGRHAVRGGGRRHPLRDVPQEGAVGGRRQGARGPVERLRHPGRAGRRRALAHARHLDPEQAGQAATGRGSSARSARPAATSRCSASSATRSPRAHPGDTGRDSDRCHPDPWLRTTTTPRPGRRWRGSRPARTARAPAPGPRRSS